MADMSGETLSGAAPDHHPPEALLLDYASGAATEGEALLIATHLAFCATCRATADLLMGTGGALLEAIEAAALPPDLLNRTLAAIDSSPEEAARKEPQTSSLPAALASYVGADLRAVRWRSIVGGFAEYRLALGGGQLIWLLRAPAGKTVPRHRHTGDEWTQVLEGSFTDGTNRYRAGDFVLMEHGQTHKLKAGREADCICLILAHGPVHYTGLKGRLIERLVRR
jgi:putative transcriptional regulator